MADQPTCRMQACTLVESSVAVKQFLLFLNEQRLGSMGAFVQEDLDERHLLVNNNITPQKIEEEVRNFTETNVQGADVKKNKGKRAAS